MRKYTHEFNEAKKRLEPSGNTCIYCGKRQVENKNDNRYLSLYQETKRENIIMYKKVSYKQIKIGLTRCPYCKKMHRKIQRKAVLCAVPMTLLVALLSFAFATEFLSRTGGIMLVGVLSILATIITYALTHNKLEKKLYEEENILPEKEASMQYEIVRDLLDNGWTFNQPIA